MTTFTLTDSTTLVTLYPEYDFTDAGTKIEESHRVRDGGEFKYKFGSYDKFTFGLRYVNSSDAYNINQWWNTNTALYFNNDGTIFNVRLANGTKPIGKYILPYTNLFEGTIELETF